MTDDPKMGWHEELNSVLDSPSPQGEKSETHHSFHDYEQPDSWRRGYSQDVPWDAGVPLSFAPAVNHLKKVFDRVHSAVGLFTTQRLCYASLHNGSDIYGDGDVLDDKFMALAKMASLATPDVFNRFKERLFQDSLAVRFAAFFDLYVDIVGNVACNVFANLLSIGDANPSLISGTPPVWALETSKRIVRSNNHLIMLWVMGVCDGSEAFEDPTCDSWRAPAFVLMKPALFGKYVASKAWERLDAKTSVNAILAFKQNYVLGVERKLKSAAGEAEVHRAMHGVPEATALPGQGSKVLVPIADEQCTVQPKRPQKKTQSDKRHETIHAIIQSRVRGIEYCQAMDARDVKPPVEWREEGWPGGYVAAYDSPKVPDREKWRAKIHREKNRHKA